MPVYNRYNVNVLCVADSADDAELYLQVRDALRTVSGLTVKLINLDVWQDADGHTREFDENGDEILPVEPDQPDEDEPEEEPAEEPQAEEPQQ